MVMKYVSKTIGAAVSTVIVLSSLSFISVDNAIAGTGDTGPLSVMGILDEYVAESNVTDVGSSNVYSGVNKTDQESIQQNAINRLREIGYEAYGVNGDSYSRLEHELNTDFSKIGIRRDYSYLILVGAPDIEYGINSVGGEFSHSYGGKTYTLRHLTVTAADDPAYGKATTVNVLDSKVRDVINNCLNTAITAYIGSISSALGTVASIAGLDISKISTAQKSTLNMNGASNWTRVFTQVKGTYGWMNGSEVEYARATSYMSGHYYSSSINGYVSVARNDRTAYRYSSNYNNAAWRTDQAVLGYLNSQTYWNVVGDIKYSYGGSVKITHYENF